MIQKSERTDALLEGVAVGLDSADAGVAGKALGDLATEFTSTLAKHGYSREFESEADLDAVTLLRDVGYRPQAMPDLLARLDGEAKGGGGAFSLNQGPGRRSGGRMRLSPRDNLVAPLQFRGGTSPAPRRGIAAVADRETN